MAVPKRKTSRQRRDTRRASHAGEAERIGIYRDASLRFAREQPAQAAALYARKLASFWWASDTTGQLYPAEWLVWYLIWSALLLATALLGAWHGLRRPDHSSAVLLIVLVLLVAAASQSLFYVEGRHRLAVEPLLLVLSAGGLTAPTRAVSKATNKTAYASGEGGRID
jgi:hypothetical protein